MAAKESVAHDSEAKILPSLGDERLKRWPADGWRRRGEGSRGEEVAAMKMRRKK